MNNNQNNNNGYNYYQHYTNNQNTENNMYYQTVNNEIKKYHTKRNRKRKIFTLIKFIIILIVLIPSTAYTYNYLKNSEELKNFIIKIKKNALADDAVTMINIIREDNMMNLQTTNKCHNLNQINALLKRKIINSPFKEKYQTTSYVISKINETNTFSYSICLVDEKGNGIELTPEENVKLENVKIETAKNCTPPPGCY